MTAPSEENKMPARQPVSGETYEAGKPRADEGRWRQKLASREEKLKYLRTAERYWYGQDWFGSEKRKNPA